MATVQAPVQTTAQQRILLQDVSWQTYEVLLQEFNGRPIRLTYDRGSLEIMTLGHGHENYAELLALFIIVLTGELRIPRHSGGSTTFRSRARQRGLEPDKCYWIANEPLMRGKKDFDIAVDPPPDLAVEVDMTPSSLDRLAIYAALGVKEVWRFDGETISVHQLGSGGKYAVQERSGVFPHLPMGELLRFLHDSDAEDETSLEWSLRAWVREHVLPAHQATQSEGGPRKRRRPRK
jgi:Uma2 family endonuclease